MRDTHRAVVAWDTLQVSLDSNGNSYLVVVYNLFTRFTHLYPTINKEAKTVAMCILHYFASYGLMDVFHSDPGTEFQNYAITCLLKWLGPGQSVTLVKLMEWKESTAKC